VRVISLYDFQEPLEVFRQVSALIDVGRRQLVDSRGLDWWEMIAAVSYQDLQRICLLRRLKNELGNDAIEFHLTRPHWSGTVLSRVWKQNVEYFEARPLDSRNILALVDRARNLTVSQMLEISLDKWDTDYGLRQHFCRRAKANEPLVLLPSPYVNVSRIALAYANLLPERKFLLAVTRPNGKWALPPANVLATSLAAYRVPRSQSRAEAESLVEKWESVKTSLLLCVPELEWVSEGNLLEQFPSMLTNGICVRDAWQSLLEQEPVQCVLCADDLNIYTRIPVVLAKQMGLRTICCAHGALDCSLLFKDLWADTYLAKGEMERNFMVESCGVPPDQTMVGAPGISKTADAGISGAGGSNGPIVFFSQPYEVYHGRADEAYREILPRLCNIAAKHGRKVIVKLHPFESRRQRKWLLQTVLTETQRSVVEISKQQFADAMFDQIWFGLSVSSSVALECTMRRIPFFNCGWLEPKDTGYVSHFTKFGAGRLLSHPAELDLIPEFLGEAADISDDVLQKLWQPINPKTLDRMMFGDALSDSVPRSRAFRFLGHLLRSAICPALSSSGYLRRRRDRNSDELAVVTYHGLLPPSYGKGRCFLDDVLLQGDVFRRQIRFLKSNYSVISPEEFRAWLSDGGDLPPRAVLLTCDDGLLTCATDMLPILVAEGMRCLFFVTGDSLNESPTVPWHLQLYLLLLRLATQSGSVVLFSGSLFMCLRARSSREIRSTWLRLVRELSKLNPGTRMTFLEHLRSSIGAPPDWKSPYLQDPIFRRRYTVVSGPTLQELVQSGMTLGFHSFSHVVLTKSPDDLCREEISNGRRQLEKLVGSPFWALAYPFGDADSVSKREAAIAEQVGYECAFLNVGGCVRGTTSGQRFMLPRLHISSGMHIPELESLVSGFDGWLRRTWGTDNG
jgi:peptidoglycan/xylan/chitin deacetylase (PgdA/CDA1 family)